MVDAHRIQSFKALQLKIAAANLRDDAEFQALLSGAQELLELSDQELADSLRVSRPTVNRWMRGKNLPHNALRNPIFTWVNQQATERLKRLELYAQRKVAGSAA